MEISCKQTVLTLDKTLFIEHPDQNWKLVKDVWSTELRRKGLPLTVKWDDKCCVFTFRRGEIVCWYEGEYHDIGYRVCTKTAFDHIADICWHLVFGVPLW